MQIGKRAVTKGWTDVRTEIDELNWRCESFLNQLDFDREGKSLTKNDYFDGSTNEEHSKGYHTYLRFIEINTYHQVINQLLGDTLATAPSNGSWFKESSADLHVFFGKDLEYFVKRYVDYPGKVLLDNYTAMFKNSVPFADGKVMGCLRAIRMIPNSLKIQGGILVAFSYSEN